MSRVPRIRKKRERAAKRAECHARAGGFTFRGKMLDFGLRMIGGALNRAKQCKTEALRVITEVETKVNQALTLLDDCPAPMDS